MPFKCSAVRQGSRKTASPLVWDTFLRGARNHRAVFPSDWFVPERVQVILESGRMDGWVHQNFSSRSNQNLKRCNLSRTIKGAALAEIIKGNYNFRFWFFFKVRSNTVYSCRICQKIKCLSWKRLLSGTAALSSHGGDLGSDQGAGLVGERLVVGSFTRKTTAGS